MTLVEIMIVIAIIGAVMGGVVLSFRAMSRSQARSAAAKLGASIRYLYDHAVVTGKYYRLTIDFGKGTYKAERSDDRFYLTAHKEGGPGGGQAYDADADTRRLDEDEARLKDNYQGLAKQLQPPPMQKRAHFQAFQDAMLPTVEMKNAWIRDLYTPRQREPYLEGKAFLYFFPDGHTERAIIHVVAGKRPEDGERAAEGSDVYTIVIHPLTGRVDLRSGDLDIPSDFDQSDEEGQTEAGR